ncbi:Cupredoxin [Pseudomassariella vexata]|uniref:Cupredoxin n=1 Tax=Pseudomassariella vexata TaxID=1141098 RepID=A0A1Y2DSJ9_9PEZI|nr:Cupredoxin [Pseudomassariella vexata]ORY61645.1 Cupredoxin [Pseudomassariella vexata]
MKNPRTVALALAALSTRSAIADDKFYNWNLTYTKLPGTSRDAILINNEWPPQSIEVNQNDRIIVNVNNHDVNDTVSLHAHGFHQMYNNQADGPVGVTQCGLHKGHSQMYVWQADQVGSFWVHSHKVGQYPYGLRAPLIVRQADEPAYYGYDADHDFIFDVSETWNDSMPAIEQKITNGDCCLNNICGLEVPPDGAIARDDLSGMTQYDATNLSSGTPMRVRIINMSAFSNFIVFADDSDIDLAVIEVDGVPLKSDNVSTAKSIMIHPGQRYSVMLNSTKSFNLYGVVDPDLYSGNDCQKLQGSSLSQYQYAAMATGQFNVDGKLVTPYFEATSSCTETTAPCYTSDNNQFTLQNLPSHASDTDQRVTDQWYSDGKLQPEADVDRIMYGNDSDSTIIHLDLTVTSGTDRYATMNDKQFFAQQIPVLLRQTQTPPECSSDDLIPEPGVGGLTDKDYYGTNNTWHVKQGTNVFLVITAKANTHPFHLHGHDFQVLYQTPSQGLSSTDRQQPSQVNGPDDDKIKDNSYDFPAVPLRRDTIQLTARTYVVAAFKTLNPGTWFFHCHNDFHSLTGMAGALVVNAPDDPKWQNPSVGESVWEQCRFETKTGGNFTSWKRSCCKSSDSCTDAASSGEKVQVIS